MPRRFSDSCDHLVLRGRLDGLWYESHQALQVEKSVTASTSYSGVKPYGPYSPKYSTSY
jgi:hypothetical protein